MNDQDRETDETSVREGVSPERAARIQEVMRQIASDAESDAMALDGKPFDARVVAEQFGNILAAVKALAEAVELAFTTDDGSAVVSEVS